MHCLFFRIIISDILGPSSSVLRVRIEKYRYQIAATFSWSRLLGHRPRVDFVRESARRKKIFVTGHTGFTGGWVCRWLGEIGSIVAGFSLPPITEPSLFNVLGLAEAVPTVFGDISDYDALYNAVHDFEPHLILHLAAQPLVRESYRDPVRTFQVNVQGTVHLLEVARHVKSVKAVLCITTDKVYHNNEWLWAYRENDRLGAKDPYSASKAAAEFAIQSFAASFAAKSRAAKSSMTRRSSRSSM